MGEPIGFVEAALLGVAGFLFLSFGFVLMFVAANWQNSVEVEGRTWTAIGHGAAMIGPALMAGLLCALRTGRIHSNIFWVLVASVAAVAAFVGGVTWLGDIGDFPFYGLPLMVFSGLIIASLFRLPRGAA